ncbi:MAG: nucleoside hydrolase [Pseudomonadota bacterium]
MPDQPRFSRRTFIERSSALALATTSLTLAGCDDAKPVILDTDIGDDIDDTWALMMLLRTPGLDLKLVVGDYGNAVYRARLLAKLLTLTGRTDIPIGVGVGRADEPGQQSGWVGDYQLGDYSGDIIEDGVQAIIQTIKRSPVPVTLICIGPVPNIAEALRRDPSIAGNARFIGMHGSVYKGYDNALQPDAEWNVKTDPASLQAVFAAPWECTITPLDTCGVVVLDGEHYKKIHNSNDPWLQALMENFRLWLPGAPYVDPNLDTTQTSTTLFDSVAVYLAADDALLEMQTLPLVVTDDGFTVVDAQAGRPVQCAIGWKDLEAFKALLTQTLLARSR